MNKEQEVKPEVRNLTVDKKYCEYTNKMTYYFPYYQYNDENVENGSGLTSQVGMTILLFLLLYEN